MNIQQVSIFMSSPPSGESELSMNKPSLSRSAEAQVGAWRRSSLCVPQDLCVEIWRQQHVVLVRDAKDQEGSELRFSSQGWQAFLAALPPRVILP